MLSNEPSTALRHSRRDDIAPHKVVASVPTLYGKAEIVEYAGGKARCTVAKPEISLVEMLLVDESIDRRGRINRIVGIHPVGTISYIAPGRTLTCWWPDGGPVRAVRCYFADEAGVPPLEFDPAELIAFLSVENAALRSAMTALSVEVSAPAFRSELLRDGLAAQIAVELGRARRRRQVDKDLGLAPSQMRLINRYISELRHWPTAEELADICGVSRRHFFRLFETTTGMSPRHYIVARRIERAKRLLQADGAMVKQVAYQCGFETHSAFSAAFRRVTGFKPSQFARRPAS